MQKYYWVFIELIKSEFNLSLKISSSLLSCLPSLAWIGEKSEKKNRLLCSLLLLGQDMKKKEKKNTWLARKQEGKGREGPLSLKTKPHFERNGENVCG